MQVAFRRIVRRAYVSVRRSLTAWLIHRPRRRRLGIADSGTPLFRTVFFELRTRCNSRCAFCAAAVESETRPDITMSHETHARVIDELAGIDYRGQIAYHVNNEPLMVPGLDRFIARARERLPHAWIRIYTNGLALSRVRGEALLRAGLDELTVNWYGRDPAEPLPAHLIAFRDQVLPRFHPPERVRPGHGPLAHGDRSVFRFNIHRRLLDEVLDSRGGSAPNKESNPDEATGFCERPWTQLNITADGRVGRCCADFYFADVMGNVNQESVLAIWHGARFAAARAHLSRGDRSASPLCSRCDFRGVTAEGSVRIERLAESVLARLDRLLLPAARAGDEASMAPTVRA